MEDQVPSSNIPQGQGNYYQNPEGQRYQNPAEYEAAMNSQNAQPQQPGVVYNVPDPAQPPMPDFQEMRRIALEQAIQQVKQQSVMPAPAPQQVPQPVREPVQQTYEEPQPKVVYVRRNLTLAEILVIFALSCGLVVGTQAIWGFASDVLPRIEIREK